MDFYQENYTISLDDNNLMMAFGASSSLVPFTSSLDEKYISLYVVLKVI